MDSTTTQQQDLGDVTPSGNDAPEREVVRMTLNGVTVGILVGTDAGGGSYLMLTAPDGGRLEGEQPGLYYPRQ
jgi:hypothetical protein